MPAPRPSLNHLNRSQPNSRQSKRYPRFFCSISRTAYAVEIMPANAAITATNQSEPCVWFALSPSPTAIMDTPKTMPHMQRALYNRSRRTSLIVLLETRSRSKRGLYVSLASVVPRHERVDPLSGRAGWHSARNSDADRRLNAAADLNLHIATNPMSLGPLLDTGSSL